MEPAPKKLLDQVRDAIRLKHYSIRTEQAYVNWIKRYIYFHNPRHPAEMGAPGAWASLTHPAVAGRSFCDRRRPPRKRSAPTGASRTARR